MIKVILSDLARTFLFVKDESWTETLNRLYSKLEKENPGYNFWDYFYINNDYLELMRSLKPKYSVNMFTSGYIQNHPELQKLFTPVFEQTFNEESVGYTKKDIEAYKTIAQRLNVNPQEILFIDDDHKYCQSAIGAGLQVFEMTGFQSLKSYLQTNNLL